MAYRALYRQYRPHSFAEVVGQEHITTILKNQIREGQISHAYLFCGSRGTGKTSTARILARAVNCDKPSDGEPCGQCPRCVAAAGENGDIMEIDAASRTGVDDVREMIGQAQFAPFSLKYRVFIIDEVHMLSTSAFNALLKILEEPPAHVLFILATTEPQKLPATIISRCQRFDFRRHTMNNIIAYLRHILPQAGAEIELEGLQLIARAADGSMRDALSLADQCLAFCGSTVRARDVYDVLGSMEQGFLFDMADALIAADAAKALSGLDEVVRMGRDLSVFLSDLGAHFRRLLLAGTLGACAELLECTDDTMDRLQKQAKAVDMRLLLYMMEQILRTQTMTRYFPQPRALVETLLVRLCRPVDDSSLEGLEARLVRLETTPAAVMPAPAKAEPPVAARTERPAPVRDQQPAPVQASAPGEAFFTPSYDELPPLEAPDEPGEPIQQPAPAARQASPAASAPASAGRETSAPAETDAAALWQRMLAQVKKENVLVYSCVRGGRAVSLENGTLTVEFSKNDEGHMDVAKGATNFKIVQNTLAALLPDTGLRYQLERLSDAEQKLAGLFGDTLKID